MRIDRETKRQIIKAYNESTRSGKTVSDVVARPNRSRMASIRYARNGSGRTLNVADAVVVAGPEAWKLIAPALAGCKTATRKFFALTAEGRKIARKASTASRRPTRRSGVGLANTACEGSPAQQRILQQIIRWAKESKGYAEHFPANLQVRVSTRMKRGLGTHMSRGGEHRITISERLFRPGIEDLLVDTTLHELAHLLDARTSPEGRSSHGPRWRQWCRRVGARPERLMPRPEVQRVNAAQAVGGPIELPPEIAGWGRAPAPTERRPPPTPVAAEHPRMAASRPAPETRPSPRPKAGPGGQFRLF